MGDDSDRDLHLPSRPPTAAAVVLHPHPAMGGDRHHPLVVSLAEGLAQAGVAALRVDLLDPSFPASAAELASIAGELRADLGLDRLLLLGYSWGSVVTALAPVDDVAARVLVAPPVRHVELLPRSEPTLVLVPAHDQYGPPDAVRAALSSWPDATVELVDGCDHFLVGAVARITTRIVDWVATG